MTGANTISSAGRIRIITAMLISAPRLIRWHRLLISSIWEMAATLAVAAKKDFRDDAGRTLRVATKFSKIAENYYFSCGRDIDIIHLNGSIEIAPILGLSDVIVDIVETGTTLRENDLVVIDTVVPISARLIANKSSYKFKGEAIDRIVSGMAKQVEESV